MASFTQALSESQSARLFACRDCDALLRSPPHAGATLRCPRCDAILHRGVKHRIGSALALYLAASIWFVMANAFPIIQIQAGGMTVEATIVGAAWALWTQKMNVVALVVLGTSTVVPAIELFCMTSILAFAESRHPLAALIDLFRVRETLKSWNMLEIFSLGVLVAVVKLGSVASVILGTGIWSLAAFIITHAAASHFFDPKEFWNEIKRPA